MASLIAESYGGPVMQAPDAIRLLAEVGFARTLALPRPAWTSLAVAQR